MIATVAVVLAEDPDEMSKLIDDAGPVAGLFVLVLGIAIFFLWRSMNKQLKRIDPALAPGADDTEQELDRALTREAVEERDAAMPDADESPHA